jgi:hypothetical protein
MPRLSSEGYTCVLTITDPDQVDRLEVRRG